MEERNDRNDHNDPHSIETQKTLSLFDLISKPGFKNYSEIISKKIFKKPLEEVNVKTQLLSALEPNCEIPTGNVGCSWDRSG